MKNCDCAAEDPQGAVRRPNLASQLRSLVHAAAASALDGVPTYRISPRPLTERLRGFADVIGRPYALALTPGNVSDMKAAPVLLESAGHMRYLLGDKGYDADGLRRLARDAGAVPAIPGRRNRKRVIRYDKEHYRGRHLIKNAFCRLKDFRRMHTRYDKLAANFLSARGTRHRRRLPALNESGPQNYASISSPSALPKQLKPYF